MSTIYKRMAPTELYEYVRHQPVGDIVHFAMSEGRQGKHYTDQELSDPRFDKWELENWWFAVHLRYEGYDSEGILIDYAGGGYMHAFDHSDVKENGVDIVVTPFFERDLSETYDKETKLLVEMQQEELLYNYEFRLLFSNADDTFETEGWDSIEMTPFVGTPEEIIRHSYGTKEQQLQDAHWIDIVSGKEQPLYVKKILYFASEIIRSY